tara:strand:+ start:247 stop:1134 length:888 start_codon:yes stop_codon:yes gene_type:complete
MSSTVNFSDAKNVCRTLQNATKLLQDHPCKIGCTHHLPSQGNVLVTGDLHDNPVHFLKVIKMANLDVPTNHVVLQELIHSSGGGSSVDLSYRMLVRVAHTVCTYPGQVHPILANHELSQATGRAITKGGGELVEGFSRGVSHVFGTKSDAVFTALHDFIMSMPLAVRSSTGLMCLHSLPNTLMMDDFDKDILARELVPKDLCGEKGSAYLIVWGRQHTEEQVNELAEYWGVKLFCVGHAWVPDGINMAYKNLLQLNSDHNNGTVVSIPLDSISNAGKTMQQAIKLNTILLAVNEL